MILFVFLVLTALIGFAWGVVVGHGWRILDAVEQRLLDRLERLHVGADTTDPNR